MRALNGLKRLNRILLAKKVIANVVDFDMHNLFRSRPLLEDLEEADSGAWEVMPHNVLREHSYGSQPLMIRPQYSGDFLEKLKEPFEGKSLNIEADGDPENLKDFSSPEDWLKHQEEPHPRVNLDEYYDINRPGGGAGGDDLKQYWDRSWEPGDSPEISEDKWLRMWAPLPGDAQKSCPYRTSSIVASYLHNCYPIKVCFDLSHVKTAKMLTDFEKTRIHGKKELNVAGVSVRLNRAEPRIGRWTFSTTSGKESYATVFQFIPHGPVRSTTKLHARVSCSCPSFLFWGAQYHAMMENYLYGKLRPKFSPPKVRDPEGSFLVCKHILACVPIVSKYNLGEVSKEIRERIKRAPRFEVEKKVPEEKLRIPADLVHIGKKPHIKKIIEQWNEKPKARRGAIMTLEDPDEVTYLAHRFPESAAFVAERLKQLAQKPSLKKKALKDLDKVEDLMEDKSVSEVAIPVQLKRFDMNPGIQETMHGLEKKSQNVKRKVIRSLHEPDSIAYIAHKMSYDPEVVSAVGERLNDILKHDKDVVKRKRAEEWLKVIF